MFYIYKKNKPIFVGTDYKSALSKSISKDTKKTCKPLPQKTIFTNTKYTNFTDNKLNLMKKTILKCFTILILFCSLILTSCSSNDDSAKSAYIDNEMQSTINNYIDSSVDDFSQKTENYGGFYMWRNYRDYLGLGDMGFKQRISKTWNEVYDKETLEVYLNTQLAKKTKNVQIKLDKEQNLMDNYTYTLFLPFLSFALDEIIIFLVVYFFVRWVIAPFIARKTVPKTYKTNSFLKNLVFDLAIIPYERQSRIDKEVAERKKSLTKLFTYGLAIIGLFFYDYSEALNKSLKEKIKKDVVIDVVSQVNKSTSKI